MYILLKTDEPENVSVRHKNYVGSQGSFLCCENLEDAKNALDTLHDVKDSEYWINHIFGDKVLYDTKELRQKFNNYLKQTILEPNKLSNKEIKELCLEYLEFFPDEYKHKHPPKINYIYSCGLDMWLGVHHHDLQLDKILDYKYDYYLQTSVDEEIEFDPIRDLGLDQRPSFSRNGGHLSGAVGRFGHEFPFEYDMGSAGVLNKSAYETMYYVDYLGMDIPDEKLRKFWEFYKKTMGVYTIIYVPEENRMRVIRKPEELYIQDNVVHFKYDNKRLYCDGIKVPEFVYKSTKDDIDVSQYENIKNREVKNMYIHKTGLRKFLQYGEIVDSWEYYSEDEWLAKSEYMLVDMAQVLSYGSNYKDYWYPKRLYLCMNNKTTGDYKIELVSPICNNLYDALKEKYPDFEMNKIKNMKI